MFPAPPSAGCRFILSTLVLLLFTSACSSPDSRREEMSFTVIPGLLGERFEYAAEGFSVQAPAEWVPAPDSLYRPVKEMVDEAMRRNPRHTPELLALYRQPDHGAHLAVARFATTLPSSERDSLVDWHLGRLQETYADSEVYPTRFLYHDYQVDQLLVVSPQTVVVKLFAQRPQQHLYQLDYVVPRSSYEGEVRAVESSIGSLGSPNM